MGLGDGLITLTLAQNLFLNGYAPILFHPFLHELQSWFPHIPIRPFPQRMNALADFDWFFFMYEQLPPMLSLIAHCEKHYANKTIVLNPIATLNNDYPYWEVGCFDGNLPIVENLVRFCKTVLQFKQTTKSNGLVLPIDLQPRRFLRRVAIHPTSSLERKNWPKEKFLRFAHTLQKQGWAPMFILKENERDGWEEHLAPRFSSLEAMARAVCESGYMVGNDSGIGHLASCCGVPTLTICRQIQSSRFWRPDWTPGTVLAPYRWIPNIKWGRIRDRYWKQWISVRRVLRGFHHLQQLGASMQRAVPQ